MTSASTTRRLTVAIIVRDAAEPLRLTLASIRDMADEVLVVDTGSTDKTRDVAREFQARLVEFSWSDDFSAARNFAAKQVSGDWVLWLDAGETLSQADADALRHFVSESANPSYAYVLLVRVPPSDSQSAEEQVGRIRLVPNRAELKYVGRVRESLTHSLAALGMQAAAVPFTIRRTEREHDSRLKKQRAQRNMRLAECEQSERGHSARLWNCLGDALQTLGEYPRAVDCFRHSIACATRGSAAMLEGYYGLLTALDMVEFDRAVQLKHCIEALEIYPLDAQLLCAMGGYLHAQGHGQLALQSYRTAYKFGQIQPLVWHVREIRDIAAVCYSVSLQLLNHEDEAEQFLEEALHENSDSVRLRRRLIEMYVNRGQRDAALAHVSALPKTTPHKEAFRSAVRGACYASQKNWLAGKAYLNAAWGHGCRDPLCLKWLSVTLLATGDRQAARPVLEQWQLVEPRDPEPAKLLQSLQNPAAIAQQIAALGTPGELKQEPGAAGPLGLPIADRHVRIDHSPAPILGNTLPVNISAEQQRG